MPLVLLVGTLDTKSEAIETLRSALVAHGLEVELLDVSLETMGVSVDGAAKLKLMQRAGDKARTALLDLYPNAFAAIGIGGGTGGEIVLDAFRWLPMRFPKFLVTTLAFDPRTALADTAITLIPSLCDIEGMNSTLAQVLEDAAAMVAGLQRTRHHKKSQRARIAMTTLGATGRAGERISTHLKLAGFEITLFHANGYGGAAFARFIEEARPDGIVDLCLHELGRIRLAGVSAPMPTRFDAGRDLPRIILPGALNFLGLGAIDTVHDAYRARPCYQHSGLFTHVKLTLSEMADLAVSLAEALNRSLRLTHVLIPMGGFSHEDCPGGAIEDPDLREVFAEALEQRADAFSVARVPYHISAPETAEAVADALRQVMSERILDA
ncbi:MAG: Tm-1-like ATP-binding domain-containing protein [Pseudomonadota bacterium]